MPSICQKWNGRGKLKVLYWKSHGGPIEMLNYDKIGTLQNYNKNGPVRDPLEYSVKLVNPYHECMNTLIKRIRPFNTCYISQIYFDSLDGNKMSVKQAQTRDKWIERILDLIDYHCSLVQYDRPIISKYIEHVRRHRRH